MSKAEEKYLLENRLDNIVLNATDFKQNPEKWVYVSDVLEMYLKQEREKWEKELEEKMRSSFQAGQQWVQDVINDKVPISFNEWYSTTK